MSRPETVGVVGAGVMGVGVAQAFAAHGFQVSLVDVSSDRLGHARRQIGDATRLAMLTRRPANGESVDDVLSRIAFAGSHASLAAANLVIENVTEDWQTKAGLYRELDRECSPDCIFAVNTSTIAIARVAALCARRPGRVLGVHFMNPVPLNDTVELIVADSTAAAVVERVQALLTAIGKKWVTVRDAPGFVSNRVLMLAINEAIAVLDEGVADVDTVDRLFRECCGHRMGPLETADLIGLDTVLLSLVALKESYGDKYEPCARLRSMVAAGLHGRKNGHGFYLYEHP